MYVLVSKSFSFCRQPLLALRVASLCNLPITTDVREKEL